jgi:hypothetical protein
MEIATKLIRNKWEFEEPLHAEEKDEYSAIICVYASFFIS